MDNGKFLILSTDGGGIRGVITARLLVEIKKVLPRVDLFAGTSTGGIIALALATNEVAPETLLDLYLRKGKEIFTPYEPAFSDLIISALAHILHFRGFGSLDDVLHALRGFAHVLYDNAGLQQAIRGAIHDADRPLRALPRKVAVTTFQLCRVDAKDPKQNNSWYPVALHNLSDANDTTALLTAALCTSAAPTYFPPVKHPLYDYCVDGGLFANNPSTLALAVVENHLKVPLSDVHLLSIGTGFNSMSIPPKEVGDPKSWGIWKWALDNPRFRILNAMFDGSSEFSDFTVSNVLGERYCRANPKLKEAVELDDYRVAPRLVEWTEEYIKGEEWKRVLIWLQTNFPTA